ncbi:hypothetical protein [uncultured Lactobacillus sp.]|uniref:hypothetical protein n=1 Tax=uncultured Lactobacillus sp. TaxID=153152 RepID=UPI002608F764|nr:hypothetical protein [uncultured Lactobacillus sp.]
MKKNHILSLACIALLGLGVTACSSNNTESSKPSQSSKSVKKVKKTKSDATVHQTTSEDKTDDKNAGKDNTEKGVTFDGDAFPISAKKIYNTNYTDKTWPGGTVEIKSVQIYKLKSPHQYESANDGTYEVNGVLKIDMIVKAAQDISIYPTQGTVVLSNGEQEDATNDDNWDGDIKAGAIKNGVATFPIKNLSSVSDIKNIRFTFSGNAQDTDNDGLDKDFDLTIDLK